MGEWHRSDPVRAITGGGHVMLSSCRSSPAPRWCGCSLRGAAGSPSLAVDRTRPLASASTSSDRPIMQQSTLRAAAQPATVGLSRNVTDGLQPFHFAARAGHLILAEHLANHRGVEISRRFTAKGGRHPFHFDANNSGDDVSYLEDLKLERNRLVRNPVRVRAAFTGREIEIT